MEASAERRRMSHPSKFHQKQTGGLLSFEILTFNKRPRDEHLSNVWMLVQWSIITPHPLRIILKASGQLRQTETTSVAHENWILAGAQLTFPETIAIMLLIYKFMDSRISIPTPVSVFNMEFICIF